MHCPVCNYYDTKVLDSRVVEAGLGIRRRRECGKCSFRFSTQEECEVLDLTIVKRDGRREPYSKEKLALGLKHSLEKRPYTAEQFRGLAQKIERDIQRRRKDEVTSGEVGEIVMKHLRKFDQVAFIRFASVYRQFEDVTGFSRELSALVSTKSKGKRKE
ncbi:MAG: transcriptional regulator NrdR [Patescibacteria group bacterium]